MEHVNPFLYKFLSQHDVFCNLSYFLEDLRTAILQSKSQQQELNLDEVETIIHELSGEPAQTYQILIDRLFDGKDTIRAENVDELYEFYAERLLQRQIHRHT